MTNNKGFDTVLKKRIAILIISIPNAVKYKI